MVEYLMYTYRMLIVTVCVNRSDCVCAGHLATTVTVRQQGRKRSSLPRFREKENEMREGGLGLSFMHDKTTNINKL
jgi:hypothetical protein